MRYLITFIEDGQRKAFYTDWFDAENHFFEGAIVFDLINHHFTTDGENWVEIQEDSL